MKKLFLIPLMALMCSVAAWATTHTAGTFQELQDALTAAVDGDEIKLTNDFGYPTNGSGIINITKSITINGKDDNGTIHTISGWGTRSGNKTTIAINNSGANFVSVVFKDLIIRNAGASGRPIETRGKITSLTLNNVKIYATGSGNCQGITIGGNQSSAMELNMSNSTIDVTQRNGAGEITKSGSYAIISFNPYTATIENSTFYAWAGLYFKGISSSAGSRGSVINAENTAFHCSNYNSGTSNAFGGFVCEDDGITITATNCTMESSALGDQAQAVLLASGYYMGQNRRTQPISLTLAGDNTQIIMDGAYYGNIDVKAVQTFNNDTWYYYDVQGYGPAGYGIVPFSVTMTGGTYDVNPYYYRHVTEINRDGEGNPIITEDGYSVVSQSPVIPSGYAVVEVEDGGKTRYRIIHSENISYNINGDYEEQQAGDNPTTSFIVEATDDEHATIELVNNNTETAYVQVRDKDNGEDPATPTTLQVGKTVGETKIDQTLLINNGLDVQGKSQVVVKAGSSVIIGEGGIVTEKPENIVIEADEKGAASVLLDPTITVNQTPKLTVKMNVSKAGKDAWGDYWWHRFAMPVQSLDAAWTKSPNYPTYLYGWNYAENDWALVDGGSTKMVPWLGYTLTYDEPYDEDEVVTYTFQGPLAGNIDAALVFNAEGFNFFGNSYTGFIDALTLVEGLTDNNVRGTIYMWNSNYQTYTAVSLNRLRQGNVQNYEKEVAPMQTFILQLAGANSSTQSVNYSDAVWGNPRYGNTPSGAPARRQLKSANADDAFFQIEVKAENNQGDFVSFTQNSSLSDAYDDGWDAIKFMNDRSINFYSTIGSEDYTEVATDNIVGKTLTLKTRSAINYTLSFAFVSGKRFAIKDNLTGDVTEISESNTYSFTAQPDATLTDRFEIVDIETVVTAVENVESKSSVRGIYTVLGQYVGENSMWNTLPAGVYVVDGVKLVK